MIYIYFQIIMATFRPLSLPTSTFSPQPLTLTFTCSRSSVVSIMSWNLLISWCAVASSLVKFSSKTIYIYRPISS